MASGKEPKTRKNAEDYAFEALAAKMDEWVIYDPNEKLEEWLEISAPSKKSRLDHIGWIALPSLDIDPNADYDNMHKEWDELKTSGKAINFYSISEIAKNNKVVSGGWMFLVETGFKVDIVWKKIAKEYMNGALTKIATRCKVSPVDPNVANYKHSISVDNKDFTNQEEVYELEKALRIAGVKSRMKYKPSVYTQLGIYRNNEYNLRPTIYVSDYDVLKKTSKIAPTHSDFLLDNNTKMSPNKIVTKDVKPEN